MLVEYTSVPKALPCPFAMPALQVGVEGGCMEEPDDFQRIELRPPSPLFGPESLQPIYELNRRLIGILIDESSRLDDAIACVAQLGQLLSPLPAVVIKRL